MASCTATVRLNVDLGQQTNLQPGELSLHIIPQPSDLDVWAVGAWNSSKRSF